MFYSDLNHHILSKNISVLIKNSKVINIISPFITKEAFKIFMDVFIKFFNNNGTLNIITTTFNKNHTSLNIKDLMDIKTLYNSQINIKAQVVNENINNPIHMKSYIFKDNNSIKVLLGSSNFTVKVLTGGNLISF